MTFKVNPETKPGYFYRGRKAKEDKVAEVNLAVENYLKLHKEHIKRMKDEPLKRRATLCIEINVDCPNKKCGAYIDILREDETDGYNHNEEGFLMEQACPDKGIWTTEHEKFHCEQITCTECGTTFDVEGLDW